jgi:DNA invertase Pin-like site-specific DNA recombinase
VAALVSLHRARPPIAAPRLGSRMGVFAEFERAMIQERVRAGLARARSEGKRLGRPPIAPALEKRIREALATPGRPGIRVIAERLGVNPSTVQRISRPFDGASVAVA